jgi:hypothetical protein
MAVVTNAKAVEKILLKSFALEQPPSLLTRIPYFFNSFRFSFCHALCPRTPHNLCLHGNNWRKYFAGERGRQLLPLFKRALILAGFPRTPLYACSGAPGLTVQC